MLLLSRYALQRTVFMPLGCSVPTGTQKSRHAGACRLTACDKGLITMDKCIDKSLCHSSFSIIRLVYTILCLFDKTDFGIIANKFTAAFQ